MASYTDAAFEALASLKPAVRLALPPSSFFKFPPSEVPRTLPPPVDHPALAHPFTISDELYNAVLSPVVPTTIAIVYITTITYLNSVNRSRKWKPWAFSRTRLFKLMVITHNIILAVYSAWTFVGMFNALYSSVYNPTHEFGLAGTVDSMCKLNGPRGVGSAARYSETSSTWSIANRFFHLGADGLTPEATDVGRLWNEGLAFYGWLFYLSKYYEVIDTLIIIAKGKRSSFLQTYHHAGAMLCMWAGIRWMSPPIWIFVLVNSFIHSIMYLFYLCSAIGIKVPVWFKRSLTTLQIAQFVVGAAFAFLHLFVEYQSPISVPYLYHLGDVAAAMASDASTVASTAVASATAADFSAYAKKLLLRAAGREGLAENVRNDRGQTFGHDARHAVQDFTRRQETRYRDELEWTHCLDTSGQAFGIYLNVLYLLPLTVLFVRFFIKSYLQRLERRRSSTVVEKAQLAVQSSRDASRGLNRRVSEAFEDAQGGVNSSGDEVAIFDEDDVKAKIAQAKETVKSAVSTTQSKAKDVKEEIKSVITATQSKAREFKEEIESAISGTQEKANGIKEEVQSAASETEEKAGEVKNEVESTASKTREKTNEAKDEAKSETSAIQGKTEDVKQEVDSPTSSPNKKKKHKKAKHDLASSTQDVNEGMSRTIDDLSNKADSVKAKAQNEFQADLDKAKEAFESTKSGIAARPSGRDEETDQAEEGVNEDAGTESVDVNAESTDEAPRSAVDTTKDDVSSSSTAKDTQLEDNNKENDETEDIKTLKDGGHKAAEPVQNSVADMQEGMRGSATPESGIADTTDTKTDQDSVASAHEQVESAPAKGTEEGGDAGSQDDLTGKEQVRSQEPADKAQAESSTGDAEEDETPTDDAAPKNVDPKDESRSQKPHQKEPSVKDTSVKGRTGEDFSGKKATVKKSASSGTQKAGTEDSDKPNTDSPSEATQNMEYEDQQSSWIHIKHDASDMLASTKDALGDKPVDSVKATAEQAASTVEEGVSAANQKVEHAARPASKSASQTAHTAKDKGPKSANDDRVTKNSASTTTPATGKADDKDGARESTYAETAAEGTKDGQQSASATGGKAKQKSTKLTGSLKTDQGVDNSSKTRPDTQNHETTSNIKADSEIEKALETEKAILERDESVATPAAADAKKSGPRPTSPPLWFEQLTSGIDSKSDKDSTEAKKVHDKIIAESEPVRDHVLSSEKSKSKSKSKQDPVSKEEQDKTIDKSETVKHEIPDTTGDTKKNEEEKPEGEAGA